MAQYDPNRPDSYAVHLANLNGKGGVVATRDIHNDQGVLLVKKGHTIKADTVQRLLNHKLVQPLETSVSIAEAIDAKRLYGDIIAMLKSDAENQSIHQALNLTDTLRKACHHYATYPLIAQKVTVLSSRLKGEYEKALFCAWFSMTLAVQMRCDPETINNAFVSGLAHDTGLLHIDPAIVEKTGDYSPEEWRAVQSHTLVADLFLSYVEGLPVEVRRAVREHHERCDGSGYPGAMFGEKLGLLGQVVAMADTVWAICKKPNGRKGQSLADVITIVKMNKAQHPAEVESALYHIHKRAGLAALNQTLGEVKAELSQGLLTKNKELQSQYRVLDQLRGTLPPSEADRVMRSAYVKLERIWFVVNGSGLLSELVAEWLALGQNEHVNKEWEVRELSLMYGELHWQLFQLERALHQVLNHSKGLDSSARSAIESTLATLRPLMQRAGRPAGYEPDETGTAERPLVNDRLTGP